ncbi:MAG: ABC transporter substrate-binding protein [Candidatus Eremiobacteraeota bacterium]|nr:ABC transporter substrate-binding protein [Candidatus Eremiobacteraeota bacterium]
MRRWFFTFSLVFTVCLAALSARADAAGPKCPVKAPADLVTAGTLTIGTAFTTPPQNFMVENQATGSDVEIGAAIAQQMCLKPEYVNQAFAGLFPSLNAKKFDVVIAAAGITAARQEAFDFVPYFLGGLRLITKTASGLKINDEMQACGHSIGALAGSVEDRDLAKYKGNCPAGKAMDVKTYPSNGEVIEQLRKGTIEIAFIDWPLAAYTVEKSNKEFMIASPVLTGEPPGEPRHKEGIAVRKGNAELQKAIAEALANIEKNKTYDKILKKWNLEEGDIRKVS